MQDDQSFISEKQISFFMKSILQQQCYLTTFFFKQRCKNH